MNEATTGHHRTHQYSRVLYTVQNNRTLQNTVPPQTVRVKAADSPEPSDSSDANLREDIGHHDLLGIILGQLVLHHSVLAEFLTTKIQFYPAVMFLLFSHI